MTVTAIPATRGDVLAALAALPAKIADVTASSREARAGFAFLAYPGAARDGRDFIADAVARGASAVLYEAEGFAWRGEWKLPHLAVTNLKQHASAIAGHVHGHPSDALWMVGVTGTNGKTSVSQWVAQALQAGGRRCGVLGTIGNGLVGALTPSDNTTPDAIVLQRTLAVLRRAGAAACAMEVSSHGLAQGRVTDVKFDVGVFTNLTRDHLDYHGTMEAYGAAKAKLFEARGLRQAVINVDDAFGRVLAEQVRARGIPVIGYGVDEGSRHAELFATDVSVHASGVAFTANLRGRASRQIRIEAGVLGAFNVSNLLAVMGVLLASGFDLTQVAAFVGALVPVPGRMQIVHAAEREAPRTAANRPVVVVDYAHTPDALEKALSTLAAIVPYRGRLICVFGCGGARDRGKRPQMGAIAARYADVTVVTSDNPRTEVPEDIIRDIEPGLAGANFVSIPDRQRAIFEALHLARADDVVLIAGKGHEDVQIVGETKLHFSDVEVAGEALALWDGRQGEAR